jgi:hypothetical protein
VWLSTFVAGTSTVPPPLRVARSAAERVTEWIELIDGGMRYNTSTID